MSSALEGRLARIEGQVRGIARMIEDGEDCADVISQISAVKGALDQVAMMLLHQHTLEGLRHALDVDQEHHDVHVRRMARAYRRFARS
jgi:DNA-binding FrmR family transcriptional regulator